MRRGHSRTNEIPPGKRRAIKRLFKLARRAHRHDREYFRKFPHRSCFIRLAFPAERRFCETAHGAVSDDQRFMVSVRMCADGTLDHGFAAPPKELVSGLIDADDSLANALHLAGLTGLYSKPVETVE